MGDHHSCNRPECQRCCTVTAFTSFSQPAPSQISGAGRTVCMPYHLLQACMSSGLLDPCSKTGSMHFPRTFVSKQERLLNLKPSICDRALLCQCLLEASHENRHWQCNEQATVPALPGMTVLAGECQATTDPLGNDARSIYSSRQGGCFISSNRIASFQRVAFARNGSYAG